MSSPAPGPLQNLYYKRPVGTPKPCLMCYRETRTVLWNPQDFIYTCDIHLDDPGFAGPVEPSVGSLGSGTVTLGEDELKKIKEEWEERQKKKKEKEEKQKAQDNGNGEKKEEKSTAASWLQWATGQGDGNNGNNSNNSNSNTSSSGAATTPTPDMTNKKSPPALFSSPGGTPSHQRFILNRQIFSTRQSLHKKKLQTAQAKSIAPRLPIVPSNLS